jgi:glycosyltransferase involved in cell wall biosynthesis
MNIGIDAYYLSNRFNTGIGNVVLQLVEGLSKTDRKNRYYLFTPAVVHEELAARILKNRNFEIVTVSGIFSAYRRIWLQMPAMRNAVISRKIDFFFGGGEYIPFSLPRRIKTGVIIHDCAFRLFPETLSLSEKLFYKFLFPASLRRADHIFTISHNSEQDIRRFYHTDPKPVHVIPNGIDLSRYTPAGTVGRERFILFVGTLQPRKNLLNLMQGFVAIADRTDARFVVVGAPGWKNSRLASYVESLPRSVRDRIDFKGYIDRSELVSLYQRTSLFASPSLHEGFGLILLEAMACGAPVLTSDVGAVREHFDGAVEYADPRSPMHIGEKLLYLLSDRSAAKTLAKRGQSLSRTFTVERMTAGYLEVFEEIAAAIGQSPADEKRASTRMDTD